MRKSTSKKGTGAGAGTGTGTEKRKPGRPKGSKSSYTMSDKAIMQRKIATKSLPFVTEEEVDYNARLLSHSLQCYELSQQADINDPESLRSCFLNYIRLCVENGFKVGNIGACTAMGISYPILNQWRSGARRSNNPEYKKLAEFVMSVCSMAREQMITDQKINPVIGIFWQRNFDGLRNDTEQQQNLTDNTSDENMTASEYRKKYGKLIGE